MSVFLQYKSNSLYRKFALQSILDNSLSFPPLLLRFVSLSRLPLKTNRFQLFKYGMEVR